MIQVALWVAAGLFLLVVGLFLGAYLLAGAVWLWAWVVWKVKGPGKPGE